MLNLACSCKLWGYLKVTFGFSGGPPYMCSVLYLFFQLPLSLSGWWWKILTWSQKLSWCWDSCACGCEFMGNSNKDISSQQRTPHPLSQTFSLWYFWMRWEYEAVSPVMPSASLRTCRPTHLLESHVSGQMLKKEETEEGEIQQTLDTITQKITNYVIWKVKTQLD